MAQICYFAPDTLRENDMNFTVFQQKLFTPMQWFVVLIGLVVAVSVVLDNLFMGLILLGVPFFWRDIKRVVVSNPVARAAILLFSVLLIAMFYGETSLSEAFVILMKYVDLAFVPIFIFLLSTENAQRRARYAFMLIMAITLLLSYLVGLQILPVFSWMNVVARPGNPVIFYDHITQSNMMALAVYLALLELRDATIIRDKCAWLSFALLGIVNVLYMVQGRTGYLILFALLGLFTWTTIARAMHKRGKIWSWKQKSLVALVLVVGAVVAYHSSTRLHDRVALAVSEFQEWSPNHGKDTSSGQRLDFYYNTLQIVRDHPLLGVGTGGFPAAYEQQTRGKDVMETRNPHNEYLLIAVQTGIVGLALLLYLFYSLWRYALLLPTQFGQDAARGLVLGCVVSCMVNSTLLDHADGLLFSFMTAVLFANLKVGAKT
jgi:O-antigen ligase